MTRGIGCALAALLALAPAAARAQGPMPSAPGTPAGQRPAVLEQVGIDQLLDAQVPLDLPFRDSEGRAVRLGDYFGARPVLLALVYYECPMLCSQVLNGLSSVLKILTLEVGRDFEIVTVSFAPEEGPGLAAARKQTYVARYGRPDAAHGWHFLTGEEPAIARLTAAVGFRYAWDRSVQQYAHGAALIALTPEGRISRYFYGIEYSARDLRLGLVEASANRIGSFIDQVLLFCYHYDPTTGRYGLVIVNAVRLGGLLTVLALGAFIVASLRRERRRRPDPGSPIPTPGPHHT